VAAVIRRRAVLVPVLIVGLYYFWGARAAVEYGHYEFGHNLDGFYDFLGQAFAGGHLYLPVQPSPQLLALPDPYDPKVDNAIRHQDFVLFRGRYYLYFGAAPAVLLFTPWRLVTGHDLPEPFAGFLLCFGGFLFATAALLRLLDLAGARPGPWLLVLLVFGLGFCQSVPFLLNRVFVYEIAIAGGYFCLSAAVYCLARAFSAEGVASRPWLAASGLAFGLAVACRPHLLLAGAAAAIGLFVYLARRRRARFAVAFLAAWMLVGAAIAVYNFERFGNPLEFGFRYQLSGPGQNRVDLVPRNLLPGVYYMLLSRPEFSRVFPWMRMVFRFPFDSAQRHPLPPDYFVEPSVGALWLAPFLAAALFVPRPFSKRAAEARTILWICAAATLAILLFLVSTHLATQRYEVDFLPLAVFTALAGLAIRSARLPAARVALAILVSYSAAANLALGIAGPYDDLLRYRPAGYVRLARWFSPVAEFRPMLNPAISIQLVAVFIPEPPGFREPLVTIGHFRHDYFLYAEHASGTLRLVSQSEEARAVYEMPDPGSTELRIGLAYVPQTGRVTTTVNEEEVLSVPAATLVAAPAEVAIGENESDSGLTHPRFTGRLRTIRKRVGNR
jgi:hypothetical protein